MQFWLHKDNYRILVHFITCKISQKDYFALFLSQGKSSVTQLEITPSQNNTEVVNFSLKASIMDRQQVMLLHCYLTTCLASVLSVE